MFSWVNTHKAGIVAVFAVSAIGDAGRVHFETKGNGADPSEEHLHETCCTDKLA